MLLVVAGIAYFLPPRQIRRSNASAKKRMSRYLVRPEADTESYLVQIANALAERCR